jgi:hypothetical protein
MPLTGSATYALLGATRPTYTDGSAAPGNFSGMLNVDFGAGAVGLNLNVGIDSKNYKIGGSVSIFGSAFSGSGCTSCGSLLTISETGGSCLSTGCSATVEGFFAGTNAERAGLGYGIADSDTSKNIVGTAAFTKQ